MKNWGLIILLYTAFGISFLVTFVFLFLLIFVPYKYDDWFTISYITTFILFLPVATITIKIHRENKKDEELFKQLEEEKK